MVTYLGLRAADPDHFTATGVGFRLLAARLSTRAEDVTEVRGRLDWSGAAADRAMRCFDQLGDRLQDAATTASRCDQVLCGLGCAVQRARGLLDEAGVYARQAGASIDAHGRVALPMAASAPDMGLVQVYAEVARRVDGALALADQADLSAADDLRELARNLADETVESRAPTVVPSPDISPGQAAAWWSALTEPERRWLVANRPDLVGGLDGIPAADRDLANRRRLAAEHDRLASGLARSGWNRGIETLQARLADTTLPRAYLLDFSTGNGGRAVVAVGDPAEATDVITIVPGAGSDLAGVAQLIGRADAVAGAAARLGPDHQVAAIAWLGYDAPEGLDAALARAAHGAEESLDSFADGLRATHEGERSHNTILGHSYGSLVAGVTARDRGLDADDLVFVGSPGVGVDRAGDLGLTADQVWSSTAANDPVQRYAPGWGQLMVDAMANVADPMSAHLGDEKPDVLLWHGLNPSIPQFGAHVFGSDPNGGHGGYWEGEGLDNIAKIALDS